MMNKLCMNYVCWWMLYVDEWTMNVDGWMINVDERMMWMLSEWVIIVLVNEW